MPCRLRHFEPAGDEAGNDEAAEAVAEEDEPAARPGANPIDGRRQLSYDISAEITPVEGLPLNIAVDYKHQAIQTLSGTAHFEVPTTLQPLAFSRAATCA